MYLQVYTFCAFMLGLHSESRLTQGADTAWWHFANHQESLCCCSSTKCNVIIHRSLCRQVSTAAYRGCWLACKQCKGHWKCYAHFLKLKDVSRSASNFVLIAAGMTRMYAYTTSHSHNQTVLQPDDSIKIVQPF